MALIKKSVVDKIEIVNLDDIPMLQVRTATWVEDDETGEVFGGKAFSRTVAAPDTDVSNEDPRLVALADLVFPAEVKAAYQAKMAAEAAPVETPVE